MLCCADLSDAARVVAGALATGATGATQLSTLGLRVVGFKRTWKVVEMERREREPGTLAILGKREKPWGFKFFGETLKFRALSPYQSAQCLLGLAVDRWERGGPACWQPPRTGLPHLPSLLAVERPSQPRSCALLGENSTSGIGRIT